MLLLSRSLPAGAANKNVMAINMKFSCHQCDGHIEIDAGAEGIGVECPHCRSPITVPEAPAPLPGSGDRIPNDPQCIYSPRLFNVAMGTACFGVLALLNCIPFSSDSINLTPGASMTQISDTTFNYTSQRKEGDGGTFGTIAALDRFGFPMIALERPSVALCAFDSLKRNGTKYIGSADGGSVRMDPTNPIAMIVLSGGTELTIATDQGEVSFPDGTRSRFHAIGTLVDFTFALAAACFTAARTRRRSLNS